MEWMEKALVTAFAVLMLQGIARRCSHRVAGVLAALPMTTAPMLAWLAQEQGVASAARAAIGSVATCTLLATFALGYGLLARRHGVLVALAGGTGCGAATAAPVIAASSGLGDAVALAIGCCVLALGLLPAGDEHAGARPAPGAAPAEASAPPRRGSLLSFGLALGAGALAAGLALVLPIVGSRVAGMLSALPVIGGTVAVWEHLGGSSRAIAQFLHGFVWGLVGKVAFGASFALLLPGVGVAGALGLALTCLGLLAAMRPPSVARALRPRVGREG